MSDSPPAGSAPQSGRPVPRPRASIADNRWFAGARRHYRGSTAEMFVQRLQEVNFGTAITLIGATALLSALPFLLLMDSFANRRVEDDLTHHLGLNQQAARIVDGLFQNTSFHSIPAVVLALLFSVAGMVSLAGMVQHLYEQSFAQPHHKGRGQLLRMLLWILLLCGWFALDSLIVTVSRGLPGGPVFAAVAVLIAVTAFFWISMRLLLGGRVPPRTLLLPAAISGLFWLGLQGFAALYFSSTIINDSRLYGPVGVVFSLLTWFTAVAAVMVLGAATGQVWRQRRRTKLSPGEAPVAEPPPQPVAQHPEQSKAPGPS